MGTGKRVVASNNRFFLAETSVYGYHDTLPDRTAGPPFAWKEIPAQTFNAPNATETRQRVMDYIERGGTMHNVTLAPEFGGITLLPQDYLLAGDMALDGLRSDPAGELVLCKPAGRNQLHVANKKDRYRGGTLSWIISDAYLPERPNFALMFNRAPLPPDGMVVPLTNPDQVWNFYFGNGWQLQWSRRESAKMYHNGTLVSRRPLMEPNSGGYSTEWFIDFVFYNTMSKLYITSTAWGGPWVISTNEQQKPVGVIPSAPWRISSTGGLFSVHCKPLVYPTEGWIETDWVRMPNQMRYTDVPYDEAHPLGFHADYWPTEKDRRHDGTPPTGEVSVQVIDHRGPDASGSYDKRLRWTLKGDGKSTPLLQAAQVYWKANWQDPATYSLPDNLGGAWFEWTPWMQDGGRESKTVEMQPDSCTIKVYPGKEVDFGDGNGPVTLWEALDAAGLGALHGEYAFAYGVGVKYDDGTEDFQMRMEGYLDVGEAVEKATELEILTFTAYDKWSKLAKGTLYNPPCVAGYSVPHGAAITAEWAGIHPTYLLDSDETDFLAKADARHAYLGKPEPDGDFSGMLPWLPPVGGHGAEFLRDIANSYNLYDWFDGQGRLRRVYRVLEDPVATYSAQTNVPYLQSVSGWDSKEDRSGMINTLMLQGTGPLGHPMWGMEYDKDSLLTPHTPRYLGYPAVDWQMEPSLIRESSVKWAAYWRFYWHPNRGFRQRPLESPMADLWKRWPHERITFQPYTVDALEETLYLRAVNNTLNITDLNRPTVTGEERKAPGES